jgi:hypothetical protein
LAGLDQLTFDWWHISTAREPQSFSIQLWSISVALHIRPITRLVISLETSATDARLL